jgi:endonuclease YncB( thermonuclease family)
MFRLLRKGLIGFCVVAAGAIAYLCFSNAASRLAIVQKAEEVKEDLRESEKRYAWSGTALVVDVLKGDTLVVRTEGRPNVTVRLVGIDAPEMPVSLARPGQPLAEESRGYLARLVKDKGVQMSIVGVDATKRPLVLVTLDGVLINAKVAEAGLAEGSAEQAEKIPAKLRHALENAELSAKAKHEGIWSLTNYVSPAEYRIRHPARL